MTSSVSNVSNKQFSACQYVVSRPFSWWSFLSAVSRCIKAAPAVRRMKCWKNTLPQLCGCCYCHKQSWNRPKRENWNVGQWLKYGSVHLNIHPFSSLGYLDGYVAVLRLVHLLLEIVFEVQCSGRISIHRPEKVLYFRSFIIFVDLVVVWVSACATFWAEQGPGVVVWR